MSVDPQQEEGETMNVVIRFKNRFCAVYSGTVLLLAVSLLTSAGADEIWFGDPIQTPLPETPRDIALGYLDADSSLDVAFVTETANLYVYLNQGDGHFELSGVYAASMWSLDIARFTDHWPMDIVTVGGPDDLLVFYNTGDGTFAPADPLPIPHRGLKVQIGDLDEDGYKDVVVLCKDDVIAVYWGVYGGPAHEDPTLSDYELCDIVTWPTEAKLADLTGDGWVDVMFSVVTSPDCPGEKALGLLRNTGTRDLPPQVEWPFRENLESSPKPSVIFSI
jgi:hypothetical protein